MRYRAEQVKKAKPETYLSGGLAGESRMTGIPASRSAASVRSHRISIWRSQSS